MVNNATKNSPNDPCETIEHKNILKLLQPMENWWEKQEKISLQDYLCKQNMLKNKSKKCLKEPFDEKNKKGDRGELWCHLKNLI